MLQAIAPPAQLQPPTTLQQLSGYRSAQLPPLKPAQVPQGFRPDHLNVSRLSLAELPASRDPAIAQTIRRLREAAVLQIWAEKPLEDWEGWKYDAEKGRRDPGGPAKGDLPNRANALLMTGQQSERVNQVLLSGKPYSGVGTHFALKQAPWVARNGDYDFSVMAMTTLLNRHWDNPALKPETKKHIATVLLNQEGADHIASRWLLNLVPETENHILMTETSRFLKNELVMAHGLSWSSQKLPTAAYDNSRNGFNDWMVKHLQQFMQHDFDEYNSRPYQGYTVKSIQNLFEFADNPRVQKSAHILMDYLSARFATQSMDLRRVVPFRRRWGHQEHDNILAKDSESARHAVLVGNFQGSFRDSSHPQPFGSHNMIAGVSSYQVPKALADLMINKGNNPYFMRARHENSEIVYAEERFMISAGGHHHAWTKVPMFKHENGIPMPTVVMPQGGKPQLSEMLRFLGRGDNDRINNTGVYENFAFGIRPRVPESWKPALAPQGKWLEEGNWTFIQHEGVMMALHMQRNPKGGDYAPEVGFVEVVDERQFGSLTAFAQQVQQANAKPFAHYGLNRYITTRGKTIEFEMAAAPSGLFKRPPKPSEINEWSVRRVWDAMGQPVPLETRLDKWPLLSSEALQAPRDGHDNDFVVRADGSGQLLVNNPHSKNSLLLSLADPLEPIRLENQGEVIDLARTARYSQAGSSAQQLNLQFELARPEKTRYISLKWAAGAQPQQAELWLRRHGQWELARQREVSRPDQRTAFRTEFELPAGAAVEAVALRVRGQQLQLAKPVEIYQDFTA